MSIDIHETTTVIQVKWMQLELHGWEVRTRLWPSMDEARLYVYDNLSLRKGVRNVSIKDISEQEEKGK